MAADENVARDGLVWNLGSSLLPILGSFVVSVLLAPYLGPSGFGAYMTVTSAATLALIVGKFGVHAATSRLLSEDPEHARQWLRAGLALRALWTLPVAALALIASPWIARALEGESLVRAFWWMAPLIVAASANEMACESYVGLSRFRALFVVRIGSLLLRLAAVFWVRFAALGSAAFLAGHTFSQALPATLALIPLALGLPQGSEGPSFAKAFRRTRDIALPLAFGSASFLIYAHTDRLMLAWLRDPESVGQFGVARNVLDAALFPVFALSWSLRPSFVRLRDQTTALRRNLGDGLAYSAYFAICGGALLFVFGPGLLRAIYGAQYGEASRLLAWATPILVLRGLGTPIFPALLAVDRQESYARWMIVTAISNALLNLLLIPRYGAVGAIVSTALSLLPLTLRGWQLTLRELASPALGSHTLGLALSSLLSLGLVAAAPRLGVAERGLGVQLGGAAVMALLLCAPALLGRRRAVR